MTRKKQTEEKTAGFFMRLGTVMLELARDRDIPVAAIHHLATQRGRMTLIKMMDVLKADWRGSEAVTQMSDDIQKAVSAAHCMVGDPKELFGETDPSAHCRIYESDELLDEVARGGPSFEELSRCYGWVSPKLKGAAFKQAEEVPPAATSHPAELSAIELDAKSFDLSMSEMRQRMVRPALLIEAHQCLKANRGLLLNGRRVVVLGNYVVNGDRLFPCFWEQDGKTSVGLCYFEDLESNDRYLAFPLPMPTS